MRGQVKKRTSKKGKARGASRRQEKKRFRFNLSLGPFLQVVMVSVSVLVLASIVFVVEQTFNAPVDNVVIKGSFERLSRGELTAIIAPSIRVGYLTVDLQEIKENLEQLPWVRRASLRRKWPHTIEVRVLEQEPYVRWGTHSFLNNQGQVFSPKEPVNVALVSLHGPEGMQLDLMHRFERLQQRLKAYGLLISEYRVDRKDAQRVMLSNGIELVFGRSDSDGKLDRFVKIYRSELIDRVQEIGKIDVRYTNGLAVQWRSSIAEVADNGVITQ